MKKNLTAFMIVVMMMLFALPISAQTTVGYAQWDSENKTLTFSGGTSVPEGAYALNTSEDVPQWFSNTVANNCTKVVFEESFNDIRPTTCSHWFQNFIALQTIEGIKNLNTSEVTDMSLMFTDCSKLKSLDLSSFNTENVTNMEYMFANCATLTSLDLSLFNTAKVTKMHKMFYLCSGLTSLDLTSFNTAKVTDMSYMFNSCSELTAIYVSDNFSTNSVTESSVMFSDCTKLQGAAAYNSSNIDHAMANYTDGYFIKSQLIPYVKWNGSNKVLAFKVANSKEEGAYDLNTSTSTPKWIVTSVQDSCTKVVFVDLFKDVRPTSCYSWFQNFKALQSIEGIENLNTSEVTNMSNMFYYCLALDSLDLSKFNTAKVTDMSKMFYACAKLTSLDLSSFNTSEVTKMSSMFSVCNKLTSLDLSSFNTDKVKKMDDMFYGCSALDSLDLSSFNTANVTDMSHMFYGCSALDSLDLSSFNTEKVTNMALMFIHCEKLDSLDLSSFNTANVTSMNGMFYNCKKLTSLKLSSSFNTANVTDMGEMFRSCSALTSLDLSLFNTANVTNMGNMFIGCSSITSLDLSSFNTEKVTNMGYMFRDCSALTSLDLSSFNTEKVTNMGYMFSDCSGLTTIYVSDDFTTGKVTNDNRMFFNCTNLKGAASYDSDRTGKSMANYTSGYFTKSNLTPYVKWDASTKVLTFKVANTKEAGSGVYDLNESANDPGWSIDEVKNNCTKVVFTTSIKQAKPTSCYKWFAGFSKLTTIEGIENLNTEEVTDMGEMFYNCRGLTSLDLSSFNTAKVESMSYMFSGCSGLTSLDLSSFNTAKVTNMWNMFSGCSGLTSLDLSSFNTAKVTNMGNIFSGCSGLTYLDVSKFNTDEVTSMFGMFYNCEKLTSLDLSSFNTANVTEMSNMFNSCSKLTSLTLPSTFNTEKVTNMALMFAYCSALTSLDLSSFNTEKVKNMYSMFGGCSNLGSIYVCDDFKTDNVSSSSGMFDNCSQLVGAAAYNSSNIEHTMANYKTGYFKTYYQQGDTKTELFGKTLSVESLDLSGDKDFVAHAPFTANTVSYARNLSASTSTWFSLCLPFTFTPNNFTAYQLNSAKGDVVELEQITGEIAAGTPVLFKFNGEDKAISISASEATIGKSPVAGSRVTGPDGSLQLCGTYQTKTFSSEDNNAFILLKDKLMNPAKMWENTKVKKVSVKPFRAYMTSTAGSLESSARAFSIGFGEDEEGTTAIDQLNTIATDDAEYYDINGRRISGPVKGLNIVRRGNKTMKLIIK